jgi:hypothetical protein
VKKPCEPESAQDLTPFSTSLLELAELGIPLAPPDPWVDRQGTAFVIPDQVADQDDELAEPQAPLPGGRPPLPRLPPRSDLQQGAWVFFPRGEQHQVGAGSADQGEDVT